MTASFIFLSSVLSISIALFAYFFYSLTSVNQWVRKGRGPLFSCRFLLVNSVFYFFAFLFLECLLQRFENSSLFALTWPLQGIFFVGITGIVVIALYCSTGNVALIAPSGAVEKCLSVQGSVDQAQARFLEVIRDFHGDIILDAPDKKIIIARLPIASFIKTHTNQSVIIECTFSETFFGSVFVQMVCYAAVRAEGVERAVMRDILLQCELVQMQKLLELLGD